MLRKSGFFDTAGLPCGGKCADFCVEGGSTGTAPHSGIQPSVWLDLIWFPLLWRNGHLSWHDGAHCHDVGGLLAPASLSAECGRGSPPADSTAEGSSSCADGSGNMAVLLYT